MRPFIDFLSFCQVLVNTGQIHIIRDYLTPELPKPVIPVPTESDAVPTPPAVPAAYLPYNWRILLRENYVLLTALIDPDNGLLQQLIARGVIMDWNADQFQARVHVCYIFVISFYSLTPLM